MSDGPNSCPADAGSATYLLPVRGKVTSPERRGRARAPAVGSSLGKVAR